MAQERTSRPRSKETHPMRVRLLALLMTVAAFGFAPVFVRADDTKKDEKPAAKKTGCGDCGDEDKAGCDGCGKSDKAFAKAIVCKDCANSEKGPCAACQTALKEGKVSFVPVSGM